jgi:hypothetical protein
LSPISANSWLVLLRFKAVSVSFGLRVSCGAEARRFSVARASVACGVCRVCCGLYEDQKNQTLLLRCYAPAIEMGVNGNGEFTPLAGTLPERSRIVETRLSRGARCRSKRCIHISERNSQSPVRQNQRSRVRGGDIYAARKNSIVCGKRSKPNLTICPRPKGLPLSGGFGRWATKQQCSTGDRLVNRTHFGA